MCCCFKGENEWTMFSQHMQSADCDSVNLFASFELHFEILTLFKFTT